MPGNHDAPLVRRWVRSAPALERLTSTRSSRRTPRRARPDRRLLEPAQVRVRYPGVWLPTGPVGHPRPLPQPPSAPASAVGVGRGLFGDPPLRLRDPGRLRARSRQPGMAPHDAVAAAARGRAGRGCLRARPGSRRCPGSAASCSAADRPAHRAAARRPDAAGEHPRARSRSSAGSAIDADWVVFGHVHRLGPLPGDIPRAVARGRPRGRTGGAQHGLVAVRAPARPRSASAAPVLAGRRGGGRRRRAAAGDRRARRARGERTALKDGVAPCCRGGSLRCPLPRFWFWMQAAIVVFVAAGIVIAITRLA